MGLEGTQLSGSIIYTLVTGSSGYNDHDNLDHGYRMIGYLALTSKTISRTTQKLQSTTSVSSLAYSPLSL
jgi:hypothetical protein